MNEELQSTLIELARIGVRPEPITGRRDIVEALHRLDMGTYSQGILPNDHIQLKAILEMLPAETRSALEILARRGYEGLQRATINPIPGAYAIEVQFEGDRTAQKGYRFQHGEVVLLLPTKDTRQQTTQVARQAPIASSSRTPIHPQGITAESSTARLVNTFTQNMYAGWIMNRVEPVGMANRFLSRPDRVSEEVVDKLQMSLSAHCRTDNSYVSSQSGLDVAIISKGFLTQRRIPGEAIPPGHVIVKIAYLVDDADSSHRSGYFTLYYVLPEQEADRLSQALQRNPSLITEIAEELGDVHDIGWKGQHAKPRKPSGVRVKRY